MTQVLLELDSSITNLVADATPNTLIGSSIITMSNPQVRISVNTGPVAFFVQDQRFRAQPTGDRKNKPRFQHHRY